MGYRSELALCVSEKVVIPAEVEVAMKAIGMIQDGAHQGSRLFIAHSIKWYTDDLDHYPEIHIIDTFIKSIESFDDYFFIRLGEDCDDNERSGGYYDNPFMLGFIRELSYDTIDDTL